MGGEALIDNRSNLILPSIPITHFRALYVKEIRVPALNSLIVWNENSLEHLELVNENYDWLECILHAEAEGLENNQFLDPFIYAAWRCRNLKTIKIGKYIGTSVSIFTRLHAYWSSPK